MAKLPGKTAYSGRRRPMTRQSGFSSHPDSTGGEWNTDESQAVAIAVGQTLQITFSIPVHPPGSWIAFGGWYCAGKDVSVEVFSPQPKFTLTPPASPDWSKFGSMWQGDGAACEATLVITAETDAKVSLWRTDCGVVERPGCHSAGDFTECVAPGYLKNLHTLSPEAHFWKEKGVVEVGYLGSEDEVSVGTDGVHITLKTCNRCARFLPINTGDERNSLSFSNHCIAASPCKHTGFGKLRHAESAEARHFTYGFQLECRFCKKYCVNAPHNPGRTGAQMKEDGARRRHFELLIAELFQMSSQMAFKHRTGNELAEFVWERFERQCFACEEALPTVKSMALDHTRPLAMLWPLDETATALCGSCNSSKSDRFPADFYTPKKLTELSLITGIPKAELEHPVPNQKVIDTLMARKDWFFEVFLGRAEMIREREGKVAAELVVKALQKALNAVPGGAPVDLQAEYQKRRYT